MAEPHRQLLIDLGAALRDARLAKRLTQERLSHETGVHRNYIGGIERGERKPSVITIATLADRLGVTLSELFARAGA